MKNKIAFFDIDGTLIGFNGIDLIMPESTKMSIKKFRAAGNLAFICSGRQIRFILERFGSDMFDGYISCNGTHIMFQGKTIYEKFISKDMLLSLKNSFDKFGVSFCFNNGYKGYSHNMDSDRIKKYNAQFKGEPYLISDWNIDEITVNSLDIFYKNEAVLAKCIEHFKESLIFNFHNDDLSADVSLKSFGKADAIEYIVDYLNIPLQNTYAFGDGYNDIEMIKRVNTGIAMGNAVEDLKKSANYITSNIFEDGIEKAMKAYNLI